MSPIIFDIIVVSVLVISAGIAYLRGFIKEVLSVIGILGALAASWILGPLLEPFCNDLLGVTDGGDVEKIWGVIPADLMAIIIAYGSVFIISFIILFVFSFFVAGLVEEAGLGALDRSLGVLFGLIRGAVLVILAYLPFSLMMDRSEFPDWVQEARSRPAIEYTVDWVIDTFGEPNPEKGTDFIDTLGKKIEQKAPEVKEDLQEKAKKGYDKIDRMELDRLIEQKADDLTDTESDTNP